MNERLKNWIESNSILGEEQNGFRVGRRAEDNIFILSEIIERKKRDGDKVYMGFLDIEKAYDTVNRDLLCKVLERIGMSRKIVNIIGSMYTETKVKYRIGEIETDWVRSRRGVRQGCVLSPTLFSLYTEELASRIRGMDIGIRIGNDRVCIIMYADDIVIVCESAEELQEALDVINEYGMDFDLKFSSEKCKIMVVNKTDRDCNVVWKLGDVVLEHTEEYKYLGVWLTAKGCEKAINEKISVTNQWVGRLGSVSRLRACKYEVLREVWKSVAVPSVMYGMDVIPWNENEINRLEVGQNMVARFALNAPRYVAVEALRGDMGWSSFLERYRKATLRYKLRIERLDNSRIVRKVYM